MVVKYVPDYDGLKELLADPAIVAALHEVAAQQILPAAKALAQQAKLPEYAASLRVEDGVRPKGRSYSRVIADDPNATAVEYGDNDTERRRILGRAANVQVNTQGSA